MNRGGPYEKTLDVFRADLFLDLENNIAHLGGIGNFFARVLRRRYVIYLVEEMVRSEFVFLASQSDTKALLRSFATYLSKCPRPLRIERLLSNFLLECLVYGSQLNSLIL